MISFDLGDEYGGCHTFENAAEAILWAQKQADYFTSSFTNLLSTYPASAAKVPIAAWHEEISELENHRRSKSSEPVSVQNRHGRLLTNDSDLNAALQIVMNRLELAGFEGALKSLGWGNEVAWTSQAEIGGVTALEWIRRKILFDKGEALSKNINPIEKNISERLNRLAESLSASENDISKLSSLITEQNSRPCTHKWDSQGGVVLIQGFRKGAFGEPL